MTTHFRKKQRRFAAVFGAPVSHTVVGDAEDNDFDDEEDEDVIDDDDDFEDDDFDDDEDDDFDDEDKDDDDDFGDDDDFDDEPAADSELLLSRRGFAAECCLVLAHIITLCLIFWG